MVNCDVPVMTSRDEASWVIGVPVSAIAEVIRRFPPTVTTLEGTIVTDPLARKVSVPPTLDVSKISAFASVIAAFAPVLVRDTAPIKLFND